MENKEALIILSGGLDSTTLLYKMRNMYGNDRLLALTFNYGSNHNHKEIPMAVKTCARLNIDQKIIELGSIFKELNSSLLEGKDKIPEGHYANENMKSTVIPFRNGILLSVAVAIAENYGIKKVYYGAHSGDHAIYPDCTNEFKDAMCQASNLGTYNKVEIIAPFSNIDKIGIIEEGQKFNVDYSLSWTCYKGEDKPCGKCGSCCERTIAFIKNNLQDPLYGDQEWKEAKEYALKTENEFNNSKI